jgi:VanZ family protein
MPVLLRWVLFLGWGLFIWHMSSLEAPPTPVDLPDFMGHALEFGVFAALLWWSLRGRAPAVARWSLPAITLVSVAVYAAADEIHQSFVPGRDPSLVDFGADLAGAAVVVALLLRVGSPRRPGPKGKGLEGGPSLTLLSRQDCHLCDEAEAILGEVRKDLPFHLEKVDIDGDPDLAERYGEQVPVVLMGGRKVFKFRVDADRLRRHLRRARQEEEIS